MAAKKPTTAVAARARIQLPAEVQEKMAADIAAFQGRMSAPVGNRISVTQDRKFRDATGEKHDTFRGVIVDFVAKKAWYQDSYDKDNIVPPNCFAIGFMPHDALEASENAPDLQHQDGCKTCPKNQFKSADNGKGKACKDAYVLALLAPDAEEGASLITLELSATAIKPFEKYVRELARDYGLPPYAFVTEFFMDDSVDYASVRCGMPEKAPASLVGLAYTMREEAQKLLSVEPNVSEFEEKVLNKGKKPAAKAPAKAARR